LIGFKLFFFTLGRGDWRQTFVRDDVHYILV